MAREGAAPGEARPERDAQPRAIPDRALGGMVDEIVAVDQLDHPAVGRRNGPHGSGDERGEDGVEIAGGVADGLLGVEQGPVLPDQDLLAGQGRVPLDDRPAQLQETDDLAGQPPQTVRLRVRQPRRSRDRVDDAERAEDVAARGAERGPGVEPDAGVAQDQRVVGGAGIAREIGHDEEVRLRQGMSADRRIEVGLAEREARPGLEPLPVGRDQAHQRHGRVAHLLGQQDGVVEAFLRQSVEDVVARQGGEPRGVVDLSHGRTAPCRGARRSDAAGPGPLRGPWARSRRRWRGSRLPRLCHARRARAVRPGLRDAVDERAWPALTRLPSRCHPVASSLPRTARARPPPRRAKPRDIV